MGIHVGNNPDMDTLKVISKNISLWMDENPSLDTLKKVSIKSGIGFGTVQRVKNCTGNPTLENLESLAKAFGKSVTELLSDKHAGYDKTDLATLAVSEKIVAYIVPETQREKDIKEINDLLINTSDSGVSMVLKEARSAFGERPMQAKKTAK